MAGAHLGHIVSEELSSQILQSVENGTSFLDVTGQARGLLNLWPCPCDCAQR